MIDHFHDNMYVKLYFTFVEVGWTRHLGWSIWIYIIILCHLSQTLFSYTWDGPKAYGFSVLSHISSAYAQCAKVTKASTLYKSILNIHFAHGVDSSHETVIPLYTSTLIRSMPPLHILRNYSPRIPIWNTSSRKQRIHCICQTLL